MKHDQPEEKENMQEIKKNEDIKPKGEQPEEKEDNQEVKPKGDKNKKHPT